MGRLQWGQVRSDSAHTALVIGSIGVAIGGAALFGIVAHTWTPFLQQRGANFSPFDAVARTSPVSDPLPPPRRKRSLSNPFGPLDEPQTELVKAPAPPAPVALASTRFDAAVPPGSLSPDESAVEPPVEPWAPAPRLAEVPGALAAADTPAVVNLPMLVAPPMIARVEEPPSVVEPRPVIVRVADVKVLAASPSKPTQTKVVEAKVVEARKPEPKPAPPPHKVVEAKRVEPKPALVKAAAPKPVEAKPVATRVAEAKRIEPKVAETKRVEPKPVPVKAVVAKPVETRRAENKRLAEAKAAEAKLAEQKRVAAEAKAADARVAEAKLAETKRVAAEMKAAEVRLAEVKRAAEVKVAEAKMAESQRAFEMEAAEAKLAATQRAVESTLAEAKKAEAKLAETKRAVDLTTALAKLAAVVKPAVEARPAAPKYERCDWCGTVTSVLPRYKDRGGIDWEVRVDFGEGSERAFFYPSQPGFSAGERVRYESGRLTRQYPARSGPYSPA